MIMQAWNNGLQPADLLTELVDLNTVDWDKKFLKWQSSY